MFTTTIRTSLKGSALAVLAGTTLIAAAAPIGLGQVKNCTGGTIDLSQFPDGQKFMRDFHVQRLGSGSAIESVDPDGALRMRTDDGDAVLHRSGTLRFTL